MNTEVMFSSKKMDWATPQDFYDKLNSEFHFTLDPCADESNHKCDRYYTERDNGQGLGEEMLRRGQKARYNSCHVNSSAYRHGIFS